MERSSLRERGAAAVAPAAVAPPAGTLEPIFVTNRRIGRGILHSDNEDEVAGFPADEPDTRVQSGASIIVAQARQVYRRRRSRIPAHLQPHERRHDISEPRVRVEIDRNGRRRTQHPYYVGDHMPPGDAAIPGAPASGRKHRLNVCAHDLPGLLHIRGQLPDSLFLRRSQRGEETCRKYDDRNISYSLPPRDLSACECHSTAVSKTRGARRLREGDDPGQFARSSQRRACPSQAPSA